MSSRRCSSWLSAALIASAVLILGSCTDEPSAPYIHVGGLRVTIVTSGEDMGLLYSLRIGNDAPKTVGVNSTHTIQEIPAGPLEIRLLLLPSNCTAPTTIISSGVLKDLVTETEFRITCVARIGSIRVSTVTTGSGLDPDGYVIMLDGEQSLSAGNTSEVLLTGVREGNHRVRLAGLSQNCTGGGEINRLVPFGGVAIIEFAIVCTGWGTLRVNVSTAGLSVDPNGYRVRVGTRTFPVQSTDAVVVDSIPAGVIPVSLEDVAANCVLTPAVTIAQISADQTTVLPLSVVCTGVTGSIQVSTVTTGGSIDPDGYVIVLDDQPILPTAPTAQITISGVPEGSHRIRLVGVAQNCSGGGEVTVTSVGNTVAPVQFAVVCVLRSGSIVVSTVTTGASLDPDGYQIMVDSQPVAAIGSNAQATISASEGNRKIRLAGLSSNCAGGSEVTRAVPADAITNVQFAVVCTAVGSVRITVSTTGQAIDANGYRALVGTRTAAIQANGVVTLDALQIGSYEVRLQDMAVNCEIAGSSVRNAIVTADQITEVQFNINCMAPTMIAYDANVIANSDIYVALSNGEGVTRLTTDTRNDVEPDWSPDGRIAFASDRAGNYEIYVMNADGSNVTRLTNNAASDRNPAWSPDGSKVAFVSTRDGNPEIYVMNADGTGVQRLTNSAAIDDHPSWSPNGARLAFTRVINGASQVHLMNSDGTLVVRFSNGGSFEVGPVWSPDGTTLAWSSSYYYYYFYNAVITKRVDGTGGERWIANGEFPAWSPNGRWIAYRSYSCVAAASCLAAVDALGQSSTIILNSPVANPVWRR